MVIRYAESPHLRQLIEDEKAWLVDPELCGNFEQYLGTLPWLGASIDWSQMPLSESVYLPDDNEGSIVHWLKRTTIANHAYLVAFYRGDQPGLACEAEFAVRHIDALFWGAPGPRYMFGADRSTGLGYAAHEAFVEYDGADRLTALLNASRG